MKMKCARKYDVGRASRKCPISTSGKHAEMKTRNLWSADPGVLTTTLINIHRRKLKLIQNICRRNPKTGLDRAMAPSASERLYPQPGKLVSCHTQIGNIFSEA